MGATDLARISHRFLLNGYKSLDDSKLCVSVENGASCEGCSAETSKRQAREAVLSLRPAWSRARARSRRGSRSALPRIASRICETSGLAVVTQLEIPQDCERKVGRYSLFLESTFRPNIESAKAWQPMRSLDPSKKAWRRRDLALDFGCSELVKHGVSPSRSFARHDS